MFTERKRRKSTTRRTSAEDGSATSRRSDDDDNSRHSSASSSVVDVTSGADRDSCTECRDETSGLVGDNTAQQAKTPLAAAKSRLELCPFSIERILETPKVPRGRRPNSKYPRVQASKSRHPLYMGMFPCYPITQPVGFQVQRMTQECDESLDNSVPNVTKQSFVPVKQERDSPCVGVGRINTGKHELGVAPRQTT